MLVVLLFIVLVVFILFKQHSLLLEGISIFAIQSYPNDKHESYDFFMSSKKRMTVEELKHIHYLKEKKYSSSEIAEQLDRPANVIRYWWNKGIDSLNKVVKKSMITEYENDITNWITNGLTSVQILQILKYDYDFTGSIDTVRRCVNKLKKNLPAPPKKAFFVQLPPPGENLQIDFVEFGRMKDPNGKDIKIKVMIFVLPYSKHAYYHHVYTESGTEIFPALAEAFNFFGGVPKNIICDNFKAIVVSNNNRGKVVLTDEALHFERFFDTKFVPCHTYSPWEKGVVENAAKYIRNSFVVRDYSSHDAVQKAIMDWNNNVASKRVHGTTKKVPIDAFTLHEQETLKTLPNEKYFYSQYHTRKVHDKIFLINYEGNQYSVNPKYLGQEVKVHEEGDSIVISIGSTIIGKHIKVNSNQKGVIRIDSKHQDDVIDKRSIDKDMNLRASFFDLSFAAEKIYEQLHEAERKIFMKQILDIGDSLGKDFVAKVLEKALSQNDFTLKNIELLVNKKKLEDNNKLKKQNRRKFLKKDEFDIPLKPIDQDDYDI
jgi:transposase